MSKLLLIDLNKCDACETCEVECAYMYRAKAADHGVLTLRERATFMLVCRRCEEPGCVAACRFDALERLPDGVLERYNLRCVSCKCCTLACPFGTIYPDTVPFYVTQCDYCLSARGDKPPCAASCSKGAIEYREVDEDEEGVYLIDDKLAVRAPKWEKENV